MNREEFVDFLRGSLSLKHKVIQRDYYSNDESHTIELVLTVNGESIELGSVDFEVPERCKGNATSYY